MTYAKQTNPCYQESPLMVFGEWPEGIMIEGKRVSDEYNKIINYLDEMSTEWRDDGIYFTYENGEYTQHNKRHTMTITEQLQYYGFERDDGKPWNTRQLHEWRQIMDVESAYLDGEPAQLHALRLITGKEWKTGYIHGCCQGDYEDIIYSVNEWDKESIEVFETEYFNTGSEWMIHDEEEAPETAEDISGYVCYCTAWDDEGIRRQLADITGDDPENIIMYAWDGYNTSNNYRIA